MAKPTPTAYDRRINELRRRTRHPVRRRLFDSLTKQRAPLGLVTNMMEWLGALMAECDRRHTHGAVPLAYARGLLDRRTYGRYLPRLLELRDTKGGHDFYVRGDTLHISRLRCDDAGRARAEAKWAAKRLYEREKKRAQRARKGGHGAHGAPSTGHHRPPSEPFCEVSPRPILFENRETKTEDSAGAELCGLDALLALGERMEAADAAVQDVGLESPQAKRGRLSREASERAQAEERALRTANRAEERRGTVPTQPRESTVPAKLAAWGWDASRAKHLRFTEHELAAAVEKVETAKRPIGNRAGAVFATILRWRSGEWSRAAA